MPGQKSGVPQSGGAVTIGGLVSGGTNNRVLFIDNTGALAVSASLQFDSGTNRMTVGALTSTGSIITSNVASAGTPDVAFTGDPDTGVYSPAANQFGIALGGAPVLELGAAGTPDSDQTMVMGRCRLDSRTTDAMFLSHRDMSTTSQYAISQTALGQTSLSCASGQALRLLYTSTLRFLINSTGMGFFGATPVGQQTVTGAKGGNAALTDLLTKLASLGLIVDSTT